MCSETSCFAQLNLFSDFDRTNSNSVINSVNSYSVNRINYSSLVHNLPC